MKNNNDDDKQHSLFPVVSVSFGHIMRPVFILDAFNVWEVKVVRR